MKTHGLPEERWDCRFGEPWPEAPIAVTEPRSGGAISRGKHAGPISLQAASSSVSSVSAGYGKLVKPVFYKEAPPQLELHEQASGSSEDAVKIMTPPEWKVSFEGQTIWISQGSGASDQKPVDPESSVKNEREEASAGSDGPCEKLPEASPSLDSWSVIDTPGVADGSEGECVGTLVFLAGIK